jgi:hypothetical protein
MAPPDVTNRPDPELREPLSEAAAAARVQALCGDRDRAVVFLTTVANPFGNGQESIDIYADNHDYEYWLTAAHGRIIQASPRAGLHQTAHANGQAERRSVKELRDQALTLAEAQRPGFIERLSEYHPYEENRRGNLYLFRWELGTPPDSTEIPPFIQVGLFADGTLACFTDAL